MVTILGNAFMKFSKTGMILICFIVLASCTKQKESVANSIENCTCSFKDYQAQLDEALSNQEDTDSVGSYKPVIYYNKHLYWLSTEKNDGKIPSDYSLIGTAQCMVLDLRLPDKQLESNLVWGAKIYGNGKEEKLYANIDGVISEYINEVLLEDES